MFNKPLLLATAFFVFSIGASTHAATMSSDAGDSGIFAPSATLNPSGQAQPIEVAIQSSAYFSPATEDVEVTEGTIEAGKGKDRRKSALLWTSSALVLGSFFSLNSDSPSTDIPNPVLVSGPGGGSGPEVAPVPELSSGMLVVLAMAGLGTVAMGRNRPRKAFRLP